MAEAENQIKNGEKLLDSEKVFDSLRIDMANNYTIKMTPKAADDLDNIYSYISEELFAVLSVRVY